ncbi:hypothetical protein B0T11DRAFT_303047 [Plectosphaerella cucumerina]|uniref:Spore coat protein SP96 n=1 Tax=Plectosphaerella cucumerina TaxID=40658 RepID=A0A8K0T6A2_9PEZI|nr:hypothetical protein B0T11DRAFT_303047 [Plectosphaerella cucumerina]
MKFTFQLSAALLLAGLQAMVCAHMEMTFPPPLRSKANPFAAGDVDFDMTSPLDASGADFPCKGYLNLLGTDAAQPVTTFAGGQTYNMTIGGGAAHEGGSCQASLSFDKGKTFTVIKSIVGGCPLSGTSSFDFTVPADVPTANDAVFAWTWFNKIGNREMYMNCAVVSTQGGGASKRQTSTAFSSRPAILVANVGNGCSTAEGTDVKFPSPGPDVTDDSSSTSAPEGSCGSTGGGGSGGGDNGAAPPVDGSPSTPATTVLPPTNTPAPSAGEPDGQPPSNTLPGGVFIPTRSEAVSAPTSTLVTVTTVPSVKPTITSAGSQTSPSSTALPASPTQSVPGNGTVGAQTPGSSCSSEGEWNCIAGTQFQRCASGAWSTVIAMAAGTTCQSGLSQNLVSVKRRGGTRLMAMLD